MIDDSEVAKFNALCPTNPLREWREVVGFADKYAVSNDGHVISRARICRHSSGGQRVVRLRLLKRRLVFFGGRIAGHSVKISDIEIGINRDESVAALMLRAFVGPSENQIAHFKDGNVVNLCISNLEWSTFQKIAKQGENGGYFKIDTLESNLLDRASEVRKNNLRKLVQERFGGNVTQLARVCNRSQSQISNILRQNAKNRFGANLADRLQVQLGLPCGWFDRTA
jgi:hypothetical protein